MYKISFNKQKKTKINHISDNHIKFEVSLHFGGIWSTVRHREHDGVFKSNFDAQNPCSWQKKKKEKYSRLHLLLTGLHLWSEIFVIWAIHKRRRNILGGREGGLKFRCCKILEGRG